MACTHLIKVVACADNKVGPQALCPGCHGRCHCRLVPLAAPAPVAHLQAFPGRHVGAKRAERGAEHAASKAAGTRGGSGGRRTTRNRGYASGGGDGKASGRGAAPPAVPAPPRTRMGTSKANSTSATSASSAASASKAAAAGQGRVGRAGLHGWTRVLIAPSRSGPFHGRLIQDISLPWATLHPPRSSFSISSCCALPHCG